MEENEDKAQQKAKEIAENSAKRVSNSITRSTVNVGKKSIKILAKEIAKIILVAIKSFLPIVIIAVIILILIASFVRILEEDDAESLTAYGKSSINSVLNIGDISELVTINGTPQKGYSLAFVDDIDEKLEKVLKSDEQYKGYGITEVDTLKQYIKAELVTQLPYLGDGISKNKLPNLDGVDILYESEKTTKLLINMNNVLIIGDGATGHLNGSEMLEECEYRYRAKVSPEFWAEEDRINDLPEDPTAICLLFGINKPNDISEEVSNMKKLVEALNERYSENKNIYIFKVFPLGKSYEGELTQSKIDEYNKELQEYCQGKEKVFFIDATSGCTDEVGYLISNDEISPKGMYPKDYQTFVSNIKSQLLISNGNSSSDELQGDNNEEAIWGYFLNKGYSEEATAGIMGNWMLESHFSPNSVQNCWAQQNPEEYNEYYTEKFKNMTAEEFGKDTTGGGGYGLGQWTFWNRKEDLWNFAKEQNKELDDLKMQLDYTMYEFEVRYQSLLEDDFKKIDDVREAAKIFYEVFEGAENGTDDERADNAEKIYELYQGTVPSGSYSNSKKAMSVTDRKVKEDDEFQPAIKLKRVIPNKSIGDNVATNGIVIDMKYVPPGVFNAYLNQNNRNVLEVFTINNNREIVFAKWSDNNGEIKYTKASSVDISTVMEKYTMPYDYIMMLNVYGGDVDFCLDLADLALESEYVIAIQDQVTTTYTKIEQVEIVEYTVETGVDANGNKTYETKTETRYYESEKKTEQVSEKIELTYADSWAVKVENDITYLNNDYAERENIDGSYSETTTTEGNTTTTIKTSIVVNKYKSGKTTVYEEEAGDKFVEIYEKSKNFKLLEPDWLFESLNANPKTIKLVDITKYLLYKATHESYGVEKPGDAFREYDENEFKEVKKEEKGTVGWDFTRAWENNILRKYMNDEGFDYNYSTYIYSCVTEDKTKYILHDEIGQSKENKIYGIDVMAYDNEKLGEKWQNVDLFQKQGINIKESEYNIYGESKIDVDIVEKISIQNAVKRDERIKNLIKIYKLDLSQAQIDCLADILYEKGNVYSIIRFIKDNNYDFENMTEEELEDTKEKFKEKFEEFTGRRGEARWILLTEGRYTTPDGEELDPSNYFGGGEILEVAEECWEWVCKNNPTYGSASIPPSTQIDCSGYVSWVLYEMGYTEFSYQHDTQWFIDNQESLKSKYGWEIIKISAGENIADIVQPGDIIDRSTGTGAAGHINIAVSCENGRLMAYDCGRRTHWSNNKDASPFDSTYFLTDSKPGIIIRGVEEP